MTPRFTPTGDTKGGTARAETLTPEQWKEMARKAHLWCISLRIGQTQEDVSEYAFRYNHRGYTQAMFDAIANRAERVQSEKHGEYPPVGEGEHPEVLGS